MYSPVKREEIVIELGGNWMKILKKDLEFILCSIRIAEAEDGSDT